MRRTVMTNSKMSSNNTDQQPTVGLALGGGAVLGAFHIGVIRALNEAGVRVDYVAGTSIGAFVAAFYAFGKDWQDIESAVCDLSWLDVSGFSFSKLGLLSNEKLGRVLEEHIGERQFADAQIAMLMVAADITNGERVLMRDGDVISAVRASTCIPGVYKPVERDGRLLVDGGIVENVPTTALKEAGADFVIAVDLRARYLTNKPANIVDVLMNVFDFTVYAATRLQRECADLAINPDLSTFNAFKTSQVPALIEKGYAETKKALAGYHLPQR